MGDVTFRIRTHQVLAAAAALVARHVVFRGEARARILAAIMPATFSMTLKAAFPIQQAAADGALGQLSIVQRAHGVVGLEREGSTEGGGGDHWSSSERNVEQSHSA